MLAGEMDALPQDGVGMLLAQQISQAVRAIGKDEPMDVDVVLHHRLECVERLEQRRVGQRGEELLGLLDVGHAAGVADGQADVLDRRLFGRILLAQRLLIRSAELLDLPRVAIEHFQDRQRPALAGEHVSHVPRRQHGHRRVEADVILAAEGLGIRQGPGRNELLEIGLALVQLLNQDRLEFFRRRALHQIDQAVISAELEGSRLVLAEGPSQPQVGGQRRPQTGHKHSAANRFQEFAARSSGHDFSPCEGW
jgi:hypothetical protein